MNGPVALFNDLSDFAYSDLGTIGRIEGAAWVIAASDGGEHHRTKYRPVFAVERAIYEDGLAGWRLTRISGRHAIATGDAVLFRLSLQPGTACLAQARS